jgi:hypothetical protein
MYYGYPPMARPKSRTPERLLSTIVQLRVTPTERLELRREAKRLGVTVSALLRQRALITASDRKLASGE